MESEKISIGDFIDKYNIKIPVENEIKSLVLNEIISSDNSTVLLIVGLWFQLHVDINNSVFQKLWNYVLNNDRAKKYYELAYAIDSETYSKLGTIFYDMNNVDEAKKWHRVAVQKNDNNIISARIKLGNLYKELGLYDKAEKHFQKAVDKCYVDKSECIYQLAKLYEKKYLANKTKDNLEKLLNYYNQLLNWGNNNLINQMLDNLDKYLDKESCVNFYKRIDNNYININNANMLNYLGTYYGKLAGSSPCFGQNKKEFDISCKYFLRAIDLGHIRSMYDLAVTYFNDDLEKEAEKYFIMAADKGFRDAIDILYNEYIPHRDYGLVRYHEITKFREKYKIQDDSDIGRKIVSDLEYLENNIEIKKFLNKAKLLGKEGECPICYDNTLIIPKECAHFYCQDCYISYKKCQICNM